jgi:hypothetical protein
VFKIAYYWMHYYLSRKKINKATPQYALIYLVFFQILNVGTTIRLVHDIFNINYPLDMNFFKISALLFFILFVLDYHFLFNKKEIIFAKYDQLDPKQRERSKSIFIGYCMFSSLALFIIP